MTLERGNLRDVSATPQRGESFDALARVGTNAVVEHIVSSASPDSSEQVQDHDEWVVVLDGAARLDVRGEIVALETGDWLLIPARTPHRVLETADGTRWLAVHATPSPKLR